MKKLILLCALSLLWSIPSTSQEPSYYANTDLEMQQKYWKYRDQLRKYFMKIGLEGGESIPCRARTSGWYPGEWNPQGLDGTDFRSTMKWADATIDIGYYIALLATEYKLLSDNGEATQPTLNELFYALLALERLDLVAEKYLSEGEHVQSTEDINGLLLRDDVHEFFWQNFQHDLSVGSGQHDEVIGKKMNIAGIKSDYFDLQDESGSVQAVPFNEENIQSLDQLAHIFSALVTVVELVNHNAEVHGILGAETPVNLIDKTQWIARRIISRLYHDDWKIYNWDDQTLAPRGWDVSWASPMFVEMAVRMGLTEYAILMNTTMTVQVSEYGVCNKLYNCDGESSDAWLAASLLPNVGIWGLVHCDAFSEGCGDEEPVNPLFIPINIQLSTLRSAWLGIESGGHETSIGSDQLCTDIEIDLTLDSPGNLAGPINLLDVDWRICLVNNLTHVNARLVHEMGLGSGLWSTQYIHQNTGQHHHMPYLGMWAAVLNGGKEHLASKDSYFELLRSAPCTSPWANTWNKDLYAPDGWAIANRLASPNSAYTGAVNDDDHPEKDVRGEFPGIDYMLMYNLYHILFDEDMTDPSYQKDVSCDCILDITAEKAEFMNFDEPETVVLAEDLVISPKFPDYVEKGILSPTYLSRNLRVENGVELRLNEDLTICSESTLKISQGSRLILDDNRQILVKEGSSLILEEGALMQLDFHWDSPRPSLLFEDNTTLIIEQSTFEALGRKRIEFGDNCTIQIVNSTFDMGWSNTASETQDLNCGSFVGKNALLVTDNAVIKGETESCFSFDTGLSWSATDTRIEALHEDQSVFRFHVKEGAQVEVSGFFELQHVEVLIENECEVDIKEAQISIVHNDDLENPYGMLSLFSLDRYTNIHWGPNTALKLNGDESVFRFGGVIHLYDGANFSFDWDEGQHSGHIEVMANGEGWWAHHFEPHALGSEILLEGENKEDLILKLGENADFMPSSPHDTYLMDRLKIEEGRVEMAAGARINCSQRYSRFNEVIFDGASRGIHVYKKNYFTKCDFIGYGNGITGIMNYQNEYGLRVYQCDFSDGAYIDSQGRNASIQDSRFHDTGRGIFFSDHTVPSLIKNCEFENVDRPILDLYSSPKLSVEGCSFEYPIGDNMPEQIIAIEKKIGQLRLRCNVFDGYGTSVGLKACRPMEAGQLSLAGYNRFLNFQTAIDLSYYDSPLEEGENKVDLYKGYNDFISSHESYYIKGSIGSVPLDGFELRTIDVTGNHWDNMVSAETLPGTSVYEVLTSGIPNPEKFKVCEQGVVTPQSQFCEGPPLYFIDFETSEPEVSCGLYDKEIKLVKKKSRDQALSYSGHTQKSVSDSSMIDPVIYTSSMDSVHLSDAILYIKSRLESLHDSTGSNAEAIGMLKEILMYDFDSLATEVRWMTDIAFADMKYALEHSFAVDSISPADNEVDFHPLVQDYVDVLMYRSAEHIDVANYMEQFYLELDKAQLFRLIGRQELGLQLLLNLDNCPLDSLEQQNLNELIMVAQRDIAIRALSFESFQMDSVHVEIDSSNYMIPMPLDASEFYFGAQILGVDQVTYTNCNLFSKEMGRVSESHYEIFPNPAQAIVNIRFEQDSAQGAVFILLDMNGRPLMQHALNTKKGLSQIDIGQWPDGVYLYSILEEGLVSQSGQIVKQR